MKTVVGQVRGVDENLRFTGTAEPTSLGQQSSDIWVAYLNSLPREFPPGEEDGSAPVLHLIGKSDMWLELRRKEPGEILWLSMKDGEQDYRVTEMQAIERIRLFVRYWGEETELTGEIRLPPDVRARIALEESAKDEIRRQRVDQAPKQVAFGMRASRILPFKTYELTVDREAGNITERSLGRPKEICRLEDVRESDVRGYEKGDASGRHFRVVVSHGESSTEKQLGRSGWTLEEAVRIAETVNDAVDVPESRRKFLRYRREQKKDQP
jgi:hypothetical protein